KQCIQSVCVFPTDGSSNGNPPERCPRPLYSRDSTQEGHTILHHHQSGNLRDSKVEVKEEIKEDDEDGVMEESEFLKEHKDLYQDTMVETSNYRNATERCPRPLYSRDSTQEGHTIPHHHQGEDLMNMKVEGEVEETYVRDDQQYTEEAGMMGAFIEEDTSTENSTDESSNGNSPERCPRPLYSWDSTQEDHTIPHHHQSGNLRDSKVEVKEEITEKDDEDGVMEESEFLKEHKDLYQDTMVQTSNYRNPPERCPRPLYFWDSTQEGHIIPHHHQGEDLMNMKVEVEDLMNIKAEGKDLVNMKVEVEDLRNMKVEGEVEETYVRDDQQYTEEAGMMRTFIDEDTPTEISTVLGCVSLLVTVAQI
ncbi:hypothetical protein AB205_0213370, partial [Aquarana catesbeiana]